MRAFAEVEADYKAKQEEWKARIRSKPTRWKRFWGWVWFLIAFPFKWLWVNIRDWRTAICLLVSFLLWSSSVWGFYLASLLCGWTSTEAGAWLFGIGNAVWVWWLSPIGSPFILLVTFTAIGMKGIFNKIKSKRKP